MLEQIKITDSIYYVGVNDRTKDLFESQWSLPHGVSYNSYLIVDDKVALTDGVDICYSEQFLRQIDRILKGRPVDYLIVNHMEPDHSGSIGMLKRKYPNLQIVGNKKTFGMLSAYYSSIEDNLVTVAEGDTLSLGKHELTFIMAPMVHWPEVMFTYDKTDKVLFSADAFGTFGSLDGNVKDIDLDSELYFTEMERYYACIVGKYGTFVQKTLKKVQESGIPIEAICPLHGPVWTAEAPRAIATYDRLSRYEAGKGAVVLYGSMYGNTAIMADAVARGIGSRGIKHVVTYDAVRADRSLIIRDLFKYRALAVGAPTYSNEIFRPVAHVLDAFKVREIPNRLYSVFGSCSWAGQAVKKLTPFAEEMKWELVGEPVEQKGAPDEADLEKAYRLGCLIGDRLNELYPDAD